jgi:hypothetical protein
MKSTATSSDLLVGLAVLALGLPTACAQPPGGTVVFRTRSLADGLDAPVYQIDGVTPLDGAGFLGTLYAGLDPQNLVAVAPAIPFTRGYLLGGKTAVPGIPQGTAGLFQVRAWESAAGDSYETARASGGATGVSAVVRVVTGGDDLIPPAVPAPLIGLEGFRLYADPRPRLVRQPSSQTIVAGQSVAFEAAVTGVEPLSFQWQFGGVDIPGATNPVYRLQPVKMTDAGQYRVVVQNPLGTVISQTATLTVRAGPAGGTVFFTNRRTVVGLDAPVFDTDGSTRLAGPDCVAQLYGGRSADWLEPVGAPAPFLTGIAAGYWDVRESLRQLDTVLGGEVATLQVRVWDTRSGATFETAVAAGGKHGRSALLLVVTGGGGSPPTVPADLVGLESFRVEQVPVFIRQPLGGVFYPGQPVRLAVEVESATPVTLEWLRNGVALPGASDPVLTLAAGPETAGAYQAVATNPTGSSSSSIANVAAVPDPAPGASFHFSNRQPAAGLDAPVFDSDGTTRLAGPGFVAQLYAGTNTTQLAPVGEPVHFRTGPDAGYWGIDAGAVRIFDPVPPGSIAYVQVRVWEVAGGSTYEQALLAGAKVGRSDVLELASGGAGNPPAPPAILLGLQSFRLGTLPVIRQHPAAASVAPGDPVTFIVLATGTEPLAYQWRFNGADLPGATTNRLVLATVQPTDAGNYSVRVANFIGAVVSHDAPLEVRPATSGGLIQFGNRIPAAGIDAPCYDTDGTTRLAGPTYTATLFAGPTPDTLSYAERVSFYTSPNAGYYPTRTVSLTNVAPRQTAYLRVDVAGPGGSAASATLAVTAGGAGAPAAPLLGLTSLRLIGLPVIVSIPDDVWTHEGGFTYLYVQVAPNQGLAYQWQTGGPLGAWSDIAGAATDTLAAPNTAGTTNAYRLRVANRAGTVFTDAVTVTVLPLVRLGAPGPREFTLRLRSSTGPACVLDGSTNLSHWTFLALLDATDPELRCVEDPFFTTNDLPRFYRARDPAGTNLVSENIAGFVPILCGPGLNFISAPLVGTNDTVETVLGDLPEGSLLYQYYPPPVGFTINGRYFGPWYDPTEQLHLGIGMIVQTPGDAFYVFTLAGDVPRGPLTNTLPAGWNLRASMLPLAGQLDTDLGCPLERGDIVCRSDPDIGLVAYVYTEFGWLTEPAIVRPGEAFWIWKRTPRSWQQNLPGY